MADFPAVISVKDLEAHNPEYRPAKLARYEALYSGGDLFHANIDQFLIRRRVEEGAAASMGIRSEEIYKDRKKWAQYINRAGGLIDWFTSVVFPEIKIVAEKDNDGYWEDLNRNADGLGNPLDVVARRVLRESLVHQRSYIKVHFPSVVAMPSRPDTMALRMRPVSAASVDDWQTDENGALNWLRVKSVSMERSTPIGPQDTKVCKWAYVTADAVYVYEYREKKGEQVKKDEKVARLVETIRPEYGDLPVYDVKTCDSLWLMDRVSDVAIALYNSEAAVSFSLMLSAYAQLVLTLSENTDVEKLVMSEYAALRMDAERGEKAEYLVPPSTVFDPQYKNIERLKQAFYEVLQSMAKNAEALPQIGRASGETIEQLREPMQALISSLGWPTVTALERWVDGVKRFRGEEDNDIRIELPDSYGASMEDAREVIGVEEERADGQ